MDNVTNMFSEIEEIFKENICKNKKMKKFEKYLYHDDYEIRMQFAKCLGSFHNHLSELILILFLDDEDELVRIEAYDSLFFSSDANTFNLLIERMKVEKSFLAQGYIIHTLIDIAINRNTLEELNSLLLKVLLAEENTRIRVECFRGMFLLGKEEYIYLLFEELYNPDYQLRCTVLSILGELVNERNALIIRQEVNSLMSREKTIAVISSIENLLRDNPSFMT